MNNAIHFYRSLYRIQKHARLYVMHETQRKLLILSRLENLDSLTYREIADRIGCDHASQVKHHIEQLIKHKYLIRNSAGHLIPMGLDRNDDDNIMTLPIMGEADCGEATLYASDQIRGYLSVSPSIINRTNTSGLFVLKARGNSMNKARVNGSKPINDGDYVLVKKTDKTEVVDGDYVVSIIHGLANIKRLKIDKQNSRIVLLPESHQSYQPIIIAEDDISSYEMSGKVVDVIPSTDDF